MLIISHSSSENHTEQTLSFRPSLSYNGVFVFANLWEISSIEEVGADSDMKSITIVDEEEKDTGTWLEVEQGSGNQGESMLKAVAYGEFDKISIADYLGEDVLNYVL
ncbi:hypothetical protein ACHQM5_029278 [Ranunculus cassubicifolius]